MHSKFTVRNFKEDIASVFPVLYRLMKENEIGYNDIVDMTSEQQTAWAAYRTALLDITDQAGFPHNITWPTKPTEK